VKPVTVRTRRPAGITPGFSQGPRKRQRRQGLPVRFAHGLERLGAFVKREGHAEVPYDHHEGAFGLGFWVSRQRRLRRLGELSPELIHVLEGVRGWSWDPFEDAFLRNLALLREFVQKKGHTPPASRALFRGRDLGAWVVDQRIRKHDGRLPSRRARQLESVPGWSWAPRDAAFQAALAQLRVFATKHGHTRVPPKYQQAGIALGAWVAKLRSRHRSGRLGRDPIRQLKKIRGWTWTPLDERFELALRLLRRFMRQTGHGRIPAGHVIEGFPLGDWVRTRRVEYRQKVLPRPRRRLLESLPYWSWTPRDDRFTEGISRLREFRKRHGHLRVPVTYTVAGFRLGVWVSSVRSQHGRGTLAPHKERRLATLSGWTWPVRLRSQKYAD